MFAKKKLIKIREFDRGRISGQLLFLFDVEIKRLVNDQNRTKPGGFLGFLCSHSNAWNRGWATWLQKSRCDWLIFNGLGNSTWKACSSRCCLLLLWFFMCIFTRNKNYNRRKDLLATSLKHAYIWRSITGTKETGWAKISEVSFLFSFESKPYQSSYASKLYYFYMPNLSKNANYYILKFKK